MLEIKLPKNAFPMATDANHSILIAGGIGITPILSMLYSLVSKKQSFEIHYSARKLSGLALKRLLATPKSNVHVYVCGPRGMINAVREISAEQGWPSSHIHFESFGAQPLPNDRPILIHLAKSNKTIIVPAKNTILDSLLEAGVNVPHDCKRGECTMCTTRVIEGEVDHRDLCLSSEEKKSSMCVCVSRALSEELKLDL